MAKADIPAAKNSPTRPRLTPGITVYAIVIGSLLLVPVVRNAEQMIGDIAIVNVLSLILVFLALVTPVVWFVAVSTYPRVLRILTVAGIVAAIAVFFSLYRIDHVAGELRPTFVSRFAVAKDQALAKIEVPKATENLVDLKTTTGDDFPQFLGPSRVPVLATPRLDHDWKQHPPKLVWKQPIGAGWSGFSAVNGFAVTLEQRGEEELVTCYEVATGKLRWSILANKGRHSTLLGGVGPRSTPTIHEGRVYVQSVAGPVLCLDGADGKILWRVDVLEECSTDLSADAGEVAWGRAGSPLIVDDLVIVPGGGKSGRTTSLLALNKADGSIAWRGGDQQISYVSPTLLTVADRRQIVSVNEDSVTGHDCATGEVLWKTAWSGDSSGSATASQPHLIGNNALLLSKGYNIGARLVQIACHDKQCQAVTLWENPQVLKTKFTNAAVIDGYAYALSDGVLECVHVESGDSKWKGKRRRLGDYGQGQLLAVGDVLLVQCEQGPVVMVEASPQKLVELGRLEALEGLTWNTLCLTGNRLLVRNGEQAACYELKLRD